MALCPQAGKIIMLQLRATSKKNRASGESFRACQLTAQ
jgi:hypothetical protein